MIKSQPPISQSSVSKVMDQKARLNLLDEIMSEAKLKNNGIESAEYIKNQVLKNFSSIIEHRNIWSKAFSYDIPDIFKNLVKYILHYRGEELSSINLNIVLKEICDTYLSSGSMDDKTTERAEQIRAYARDNYFKFTYSSKDINWFEGNCYQQINYKNDAKTNASSLYNAKIYQRNTILNYIHALRHLINLEICPDIIRSEGVENIMFLNAICKNIIPDAETDWKKADEKDWKIHVGGQRIDIESEITEFLKRCSNDNLPVERALQIALVKTQREVLNMSLKSMDDIYITLSNKEENVIAFKSSIQFAAINDSVNPAPIRSAYRLFDADDIEKDFLINTFEHNVEIGNSYRTSIIRNGFCHSPQAAKEYLEIMVERAQKNQPQKNPIIIVDNRLMYNVDDLLEGERKHLNNHNEYINQAISSRRRDNPSSPEIKFIPLNFPPKDHGLLANKQANKESLIELHKVILSLNEHNDLIESDNLLYKLCFGLFTKYYQNPDYYLGEIAFNFAFIIQIMLSFLPIEFSEGCKSNKDRGGSKKWHDEVYAYVVYYLISDVLRGKMTEEDLMSYSLENIFTINESNRDNARKIALKNTIAPITAANTGISGSKNTAGVRSLINGLKIDKEFFTGNRGLVKKVKS